jgi:endoglucanase
LDLPKHLAVLQFIGHGTLNLVAQAENIGHMTQTLSNPVPDNCQELLWPALDRSASGNILTALYAIPHMDASYKEKLRPYVVKYKEYIDELEKDNPCGVPIGPGNWTGSGGVVSF